MMKLKPANFTYNWKPCGLMQVFYAINVDDMLDLKSILVPALIIQPFIENAIWHGIVPRGGGGNVSLSVLKNN